MAEAGRRRQRSFFLWLLEFGFTQCNPIHACSLCLRPSKACTKLTLGCYVDNLLTLYTHDGAKSLYSKFIDALTQRWNVEDEGPITDLLNVDIVADDDSVRVTQQKYIAHLVLTYLYQKAFLFLFTKHERQFQRHTQN
eukprot:5489172-Pleurochrysis_carterae.AAC.3